jgi:hypothetical protein
MAHQDYNRLDGVPAVLAAAATAGNASAIGTLAQLHEVMSNSCEAGFRFYFMYLGSHSRFTSLLVSPAPDLWVVHIFFLIKI